MTIRKLDSQAREWTARLRSDQTTPLVVEGLHPVERAAVDTKYGYAAEHARRYIASDGLDDGWDGPRPIMLLYTRGRKSQQWRRVPVMYFEFDDERYLVGSNGGGDDHPLWYLNLHDDPDIYVRVGADFYSAVAATLPASERERLWPHLVSAYPIHAEYQSKTDRQVPLVRVSRVEER